MMEFIECSMLSLVVTDSKAYILLAKNLAYFRKFAKIRKNAYLRYFVKYGISCLTYPR